LVAEGTRARRDRLDGPGREHLADDELRRAGITPGHPSLYGQPGGSEAGGTGGPGSSS
jgi:hypothetical protein